MSPSGKNFLYPNQEIKYFIISNCDFNFNILALVLSDILGGPKFTLGGPVPPVHLPAYFTIFNDIFNFNFLALVVSEVLGDPKFTLGGPTPPQKPRSGKILTYAQVLAYIYIVASFELRSSINEGIMERSLHNRFWIERSAKMEFWGGFFWGGEDIWREPSRNAMTADLRRLVKKLWR